MPRNLQHGVSVAGGAFSIYEFVWDWFLVKLAVFD
jgi:hypothetical protein